MPVTTFAADNTLAQWAAIAGLLSGNLNVGESNGAITPGTGTNPSGLLPTVAAVGKSEWPDFSVLPYVGVRPQKVTRELVASPRRFHVTTTYLITALVGLEANEEQMVGLDDAFLAVAAIVSDGAGNGIQPILEARANFSLLGAVYRSMVRDVTYDWDKNATGKGPAFVAWAQMSYDAEILVQQ